MSSECSILIVEDDASIRRLVRTVLLRQSYQVEIAADGLEAIAKLAVADYDVIITSAASPAVINERLKGIEFDLLPKPFDIHELLSRVQACAKRGAGLVD